MIKIGQLANRRLEAVIPIEVEQEGGTFEKVDFRVVFRDMPIAAEKELIGKVSDELMEQAKAYDEKAQPLHEKVRKARDEILELSGKNGDSPKKVKDLEKKIADYEKAIAELKEPPTWQQLYLSKIVEKLPDLVDKDGETVLPPTPETFARLGVNTEIVIRHAISERLGRVVDQKK